MLVTVPLQENKFHNHSISHLAHGLSLVTLTLVTATVWVCLCSKSNDVCRISAISYCLTCYTIGLTDNDIIKDPLVVTITELGSMCRGLLLPYILYHFQHFHDSQDSDLVWLISDSSCMLGYFDVSIICWTLTVSMTWTTGSWLSLCAYKLEYS